MGEYYRTAPHPTAIRVHAYSLPPLPGLQGHFVTAYEPGTVIGPIEAITETTTFLSVQVGDLWINLARKSRGGHVVNFALPLAFNYPQ